MVKLQRLIRGGLRSWDNAALIITLLEDSVSCDWKCPDKGPRHDESKQAAICQSGGDVETRLKFESGR